MEKKKLVFLVDLDGTVADLDQALISALPNLQFEIIDRKASEFEGDLEKAVRAVMMQKGFFFNLPLFPEAKQNISDLQERGRVVFVSFVLKNAAYGMAEKVSWIEKHFGLELARSAIFSKDKTMILGDYLIDDRPQIGSNCPPPWKQLFPSRTYNSHVSPELRLPSRWISHFMEMKSLLLKPNKVFKIEEKSLCDINWHELGKNDLDTMWSTQTQYNKKQIYKLMDEAVTDKKLPPIYSDQNFGDAIDDVYGMDDHISEFQYVVLLQEEGVYLGHIYMFLHPDDSKAYIIGIRGRPDKFIIRRIPNVATHLIEACIRFAKEAKKRHLMVAYPRDNMISTFEKLGFQKCNNPNVAHLHTRIIPALSVRETSMDSYQKEI